MISAVAGYIALISSRQTITWRSRVSSILDGGVCGFVVSCLFCRHLATMEDALVVAAGAVITAFIGGAALDHLETILREVDDESKE